MKTFKKFLESYEPVNEAEYNKEWWDSKSDSFKKRYIERHPNSIYAQKANSQPSKKDSKSPSKGGEKDHGKDSPEEKKDNSFWGSLFGRNKEKDTNSTPKFDSKTPYKEVDDYWKLSRGEQKSYDRDWDRSESRRIKADNMKPEDENKYVISQDTLNKFKKKFGTQEVKLDDGRTFYINNLRPGWEKAIKSKFKDVPDGAVIDMADYTPHSGIWGFTNPKSAKKVFGSEYNKEERRINGKGPSLDAIRKKWPVGKEVDPDDPKIPDNVLIDDDGKIIGYTK